MNRLIYAYIQGLWVGGVELVTSINPSSYHDYCTKILKFYLRIKQLCHIDF